MNSSQLNAGQMFNILRDKGAITKLTTRDILNRVVEAKKNGVSADFSNEDLSGLDLSQKTIVKIFEEGGYSEANPPAWYSGDIKREKVTNRAEIIASAREPDALEVVCKKAIDLEGVNFHNSVLVCANLEGADLTKANFTGAKLQYANMRRTRLWDADFSNASLDGADLSKAALQNAIFCWSSLNDTILHECFLHSIKIENTELSKYQVNEIWEEIKAKDLAGQKKEASRYYADAAQAYNRLKNNFRDIGKPDDASWAFIKEKRLERNTYKIFSCKRAGNWIMDHSCCYGERPWQIFFVTLVIVILFGWAYWLMKAITSSMLEDNLVFSLGTFVNLTFSSMEAKGICAQFLASFEAGVGIALFALLMYSLGRRMTGY